MTSDELDKLTVGWAMDQVYREALDLSQIGTLLAILGKCTDPEMDKSYRILLARPNTESLGLTAAESALHAVLINMPAGKRLEAINGWWERRGK